MARLHEYQGKAVLARAGIPIPRGGPASSPAEAATVATDLACPCVIKIQSWTTGRAAIGGVAFADTPAQAADHAKRMLAMTVGNFPVSHVLVEEKLAIASELFVSFSIDDRARAPIILLAPGGGTGIEERAATVRRIPCDVLAGPEEAALNAAVGAMPLDARTKPAVADALRRVFDVARSIEARSVEINPLVVTRDGRVMAADCRITVDDYAVFRHPELGIEIARELDHPPTELERTAYQIEQDDHRGTFFFAQMNTAAGTATLRVASGSERHAERGGTQSQSKGLIGFHGAGGGGSMMSMDAITNEGFTIANFCDTSGNPSPAKVYRAARIILSQPGLIGYFGSGSGVANQEQFWSAYGLAKAFWEMNLDIPAVIRLGGNTEDRAVEILQDACKNLPGKVEGYKKTDPPARIAARFAALVAEHQRQHQRGGTGGSPASGAATWMPRSPRRPSFVGSAHAMSFPVKGGTVWIDLAAWKTSAPAIISRANGLFRDDSGKPALTVSPDAFLSKDSDLIACEVECRRNGIDAVHVELDIPGLDASLAAARA
jgi:succinyl-CoA synthetase beta subunit